MDAGLSRIYIDRALDQMLDCAERVGPRLNDRPFGDATNSIAAVIAHCDAVGEFWLGHVGLGRPSDRQRDKEFSARASLDELRETIDEMSVRIFADIESLTNEGGQPSELREFLPGDGSDDDLILHVIEELYQHVGQMQLTVDAFESGHIPPD